MLTLILASLLANASGPGNSNNYLYNINHNQRSDTVDVLHFHVNLSPEEALECVTGSASRAIGARDAGTAGSTSPVLSVQATTVREALATGAPDRRVEAPGPSAGQKRNRK